jgi:hypothetical protein
MLEATVNRITTETEIISHGLKLVKTAITLKLKSLNSQQTQNPIKVAERKKIKAR